VADTTFTIADVERLAGVLDSVELDDQDRRTLHAVFALAGSAVAGEDDEVSGFAFDAYLSIKGSNNGAIAPSKNPATGGLFGSFTLGVTPTLDALNPQPLPP
jgi:hypothetical protein